MTSDNNFEPLSARHVLSAHIVNLKTIARHAAREPLPFVRFVLKRTVAKVDSIGFVVRMCIHCSAGKS